MRIFGIETSCDETSAAVVDDGTTVLSCPIATSRDAFARSGGVIPEDAARKQVEAMLPIVTEALKTAGCTLDDMDAIAVTHCPGLLGSLLVGTTTARVLSWSAGKPLIPVHHTLGHLDSVWLRDSADAGAADERPSLPCLTLSVSGGHSDLWLRESHTRGRLLGTTLDDAAGEAFDKGAMLLGLPYPGGPSIAKAADSGNEQAFRFPAPMPGGHDFSFSGLKTALKYVLRDLPDAERTARRSDLAASYQFAICRHLADRVVRAQAEHPACKEVHVVGGVSANARLRLLLREKLPSGVSLRTPSKILYCTDNAAMIAAAGYFLTQEKPETANAEFQAMATAKL